MWNACSVAVIDVKGAIIHRAKPILRKPRPQENLWSFDLMLCCLITLTLTFFLLTIYSILQTNTTLLPPKATRFLSFKIMDTSSSASLFVTLLGALLVRHQFAMGLLPRINYKSTNATRQDSGSPMVSFETWRVEIRNSGLGAAVINSTRYVLELPSEKSNVCPGDHKDIIKGLTKLGLVRNSDYWLENITTGFALSSKEDCFVFEIKTEHIAKVERLDMMLYFQDQLGGKYCREIFLIPHGVDKTGKQGI